MGWTLTANTAGVDVISVRCSQSDALLDSWTKGNNSLMSTEECKQAIISLAAEAPSQLIPETESSSSSTDGEPVSKSVQLNESNIPAKSSDFFAAILSVSASNTVINMKYPSSQAVISEVLPCWQHSIDTTQLCCSVLAVHLKWCNQLLVKQLKTACVLWSLIPDCLSFSMDWKDWNSKIYSFIPRRNNGCQRCHMNSWPHEWSAGTEQQSWVISNNVPHVIILRWFSKFTFITLTAVW